MLNTQESIMGADQKERELINDVLSVFPFKKTIYKELENIKIYVLNEKEAFQPYIKNWNNDIAVIDEEPLPGGVYLHNQNILLLRRPLDEHLIAHEYAHAVDKALGYISEEKSFKSLYQEGGKAISKDAYFSNTEWFAENLAASLGWTLDGKKNEEAKKILYEVEPKAAVLFESFLQKHRTNTTNITR